MNAKATTEKKAAEKAGSEVKPAEAGPNPTENPPAGETVAPVARQTSGAGPVSVLGDVPVMRRSMNRGNTRRLVKASEDLRKACDAFVAQVDPHVFVANEKGKRVGQWPICKAVSSFRDFINTEVSVLVAQPAPAEDE